MPDRSWRCFVGVPIGDELRHELRTTVEALRATLPIAHDALRWTEPEGWHVSLAFLGPTHVDAIPRLAELL
ncbi:MAG: RNA 2',3'-cyclic phosphodiesterase, partial [Candidatus Limnocylindria bacterium]